MDRDYALVFTDLVGSTALNTALGDAAMLAIWDAHDAASRVLLAQWSGREVERTDGLLAVFDSADEACGFAVAYHLVTAAVDRRLQARVGLHVGPVHLRCNPAEHMRLGARPLEVLGLTKAICARLMALASPGQTLASAEAIARLAPDVRSIAVVSHGFWRLKGLDAPLEVFGVSDGTQPQLPPVDGDKAYRVARSVSGWVALRDVRCTLPAEGNGFFGRDHDLQVLRGLLDREGAMVTVAGLGGMGKTRLAVRYGWCWFGEHPGGTFFCDLSSAAGLNGIWSAVARGLRVPIGDEPARQLGDALAALGDCLVIFDNFEQLASLAGQSLGLLQHSAPRARFVVTSRERLGLPHEQVLALGPLTRAAAVSLFNDRAQAVHPAYSAPSVSAVLGPLVDLLDGMPLALELAAARSAVLTPEQLLLHMSDRFRLLAAHYGRPDRQATLLATLEWSWELLSTSERADLASLSVFEGTFNLQAAASVLPNGPAAVSDLLMAADALQRLVDKSLVAAGPAKRFRLLGCVRDFAGDRLVRLEGAADATDNGCRSAAQRHQAYFAMLGEQGAMNDDCADVADLGAACRRAARHRQEHDAVACLRAAWAALRLVGPFATAVELATEVLALPLAGTLRQQAQWVLGAAFFAAGRNADALQAIMAGVNHGSPDQDPVIAARLYCTLGEVHSAAGRADAAATALDEAMRYLASRDEVSTRCQVMNARGALHADLGRLDEAQACYEEALAVAANAGDQRWQAGVLGNLAVLWFSAGRLDEARVACLGSLTHARASGDQRWEGNAQCNLGLIECQSGRLDEAQAALGAALVIARHLGHRSLEVTSLCNLGLVQEKRGELVQACEHHAAAVKGAQRIGDVRIESQLRACLGSAQARLGLHAEARRTLEHARCELADSDDVLTLALLMCSVAENECLSGQLSAAQQALGEASALAARCAATPESELGLRCAQVRDLVTRVSLG